MRVHCTYGRKSYQKLQLHIFSNLFGNLHNRMKWLACYHYTTNISILGDFRNKIRHFTQLMSEVCVFLIILVLFFIFSNNKIYTEDITLQVAYVIQSTT